MSGTVGPPKTRRVGGVSTGVRAGICCGCGLAAGTVIALAGRPSDAAPVGWDVAGVLLLAWTWFTIWPMGTQSTEAHATREDPSRPLSDVVLLAAAVVSLGAVGILLEQASTQGAARDLAAALGVSTVAVSWAVVHTVFTLRYASLYYSGTDGGISFNQATRPRYSDFAYLGFTLGMTFQVSDTDLQDPTIRATALRHALLSYVFGSIIIATSINLIAGLGGSG